MEQPKRSFFQRHPGFDAYSLFWLVLFLILAALGRFSCPCSSRREWCWCTCSSACCPRTRRSGRWKTPVSMPSSGRSAAGSGAARGSKRTKPITTSSVPPAASPCGSPGDWGKLRSPVKLARPALRYAPNIQRRQQGPGAGIKTAPGLLWCPAEPEDFIGGSARYGVAFVHDRFRSVGCPHPTRLSPAHLPSRGRLWVVPCIIKRTTL